ncbi:hypothetical protein MUK60_19990 [Streptomyces sp. LRE541]|uniref:hypothetical protein n=1 Tax=Streptomyces sp. LRE541 TaxID=2931983 RepID=UPI00200F6269|nr:hypothetical protein [Streptomyces sp. LRE541]UPZ29877.1 hypothetical protein MUK60_19990 [Streptomyces sp. LRE541]
MNDHPARPDATPPAEATDAPDPATTPEAAPETAPEADPETAPEAGPVAASEAGSETAPEVGPVAAPEADPEAASEPGPEAAPEGGPTAVVAVAPEAGPEAAPKAGPEITSGMAPEPGPKTGAGAAPEAGPEAIPEPRPGTGAEVTPETAPEAGPEAAPGAGIEAGSETASGPDPEVAPEAGVVPGPGPGGVAVAAPRRRVRWGRVLTGAACGALLLGVVGGVGFTVVAVDRADRDAGAPVWRFPKEGADVAVDGDKAGLAGLLVPYETDPNTDGFTRGPDIEEFGSDSEFSGRQATELRKESVRDLPRSQRLRLEKQIDRQHIQGMAMRSYVSPPDSLGYDGKVFTVDVVLSQMDKKAVRDVATFQSEFLNALEIFRKGPKIEGHKNAQCFLPPKDADEKLDLMVCSAYKGDVMVSATAYGAKPLDTKGVAVFLREQLDRIAEPGEAV